MSDTRPPTHPQERGDVVHQPPIGPAQAALRASARRGAKLELHLGDQPDQAQAPEQRAGLGAAGGADVHAAGGVHPGELRDEVRQRAVDVVAAAVRRGGQHAPWQQRVAWENMRTREGPTAQRACRRTRGRRASGAHAHAAGWHAPLPPAAEAERAPREPRSPSVSPPYVVGAPRGGDQPSIDAAASRPTTVMPAWTRRRLRRTSAASTRSKPSSSTATRRAQPAPPRQPVSPGAAAHGNGVVL
jgi:hypothetical protein